MIELATNTTTADSRMGNHSPDRPVMEETSVVTFHLRLLVVLLAHLRNEVELRLEPVDVLFLGFHDVDEKLAADVVAAGLAIGDRGLEGGMGRALELQVA